jgi:hypothetical protein
MALTTSFIFRKPAGISCGILSARLCFSGWADGILDSRVRFRKCPPERPPASLFFGLAAGRWAAFSQPTCCIAFFDRQFPNRSDCRQIASCMIPGPCLSDAVRRRQSETVLGGNVPEKDGRRNRPAAAQIVGSQTDRVWQSFDLGCRLSPDRPWTGCLRD